MKCPLWFQIVRAVCTIVWAALMFSIGILSLLNYHPLMSDIQYFILWVLGGVMTLIVGLMWNIKEEENG